MNPREWFALLFGAAPPGTWLTVSTKRDSASRSAPEDPFLTRWFPVSELCAAAEYATTEAERANVYMGMGLRRQQLGQNQRGCAEDVCVISGLWLEVDVAGGTHAVTRRAYFPTKVAALAFLEALPLPPSVILDSGGGLHAHWLFREPLVIEEDTDFTLATGLVRGWQAFVRSRTTHEIDSTHDLARVLRVPGTFNRKNGSVAPVTVLSLTDNRYNPDDFAEWIELGTETAPLRTPKGLVARPGAEPPGIKFLALRENDKRFRDHWEEKPINPRDNSSSAHCMGLATIAAKAGWADQEILDLLTAFLAHSKNTQHKTRGLGWHAVTIAKARQGHEAEAERSLRVQRVSGAMEPEERIAALSALLGVRLRRVVRRFHRDELTGMTMDPWYVLETEDDSRVFIEGADVLASLPKFKAKILGHLNICLEVSARDWPRVVEALARAAITDDAPPEANPCEDVRQAVREYLERRSSTHDPIAAHDMNQVYENEGRHWFSASRWAEWARMRKGMDVGNRNITRTLELAGCQRRTLNNLTRPNGKKTKLTFWRLADAAGEGYEAN